MRANEFLAELADLPYPYERSMNGAVFYDKHGEQVAINFDNVLDSPDIWAVAFSRGSFRHFGKTGKGDQYRIFATVIKIIKEWLRQVNPKFLTFSSSKLDMNRSDVYSTLIRRFGQGLGYTDVSKNINAIADPVFKDKFERTKQHYAGDDIFILARNDQLQPPTQLSELADQPYPFDIATHRAGESRFGFTTENGDEYLVLVIPQQSGQTFQSDQLRVDFAKRTRGASEYTDKQTGTAGSASLRIFSTVFAALKAALAYRTKAGLAINRIVFSGRNLEPSRIALYRRFAKNVGRYLPGWEFESESADSDATEFTVVRKR